MGSFHYRFGVIVRRVERMTPLTDRGAGWVRKPLQDR
jgi:hypothetical protein